jgi:hypothetical protein
MSKYVAPSIPFVEARHVGRKQKPTAIVLSLSSTTSEKGAALGIASYHHSASSPLVSHHYIIDEAETYRCISDNVAAYHSPHGAISILLCAEPDEFEPHWPVLTRAAELVAVLIYGYGIPNRYLDEEMEESWKKHKWRRRGGLIVRAAGTWPYSAFLDDVERRRL